MGSLKVWISHTKALSNSQIDLEGKSKRVNSCREGVMKTLVAWCTGPFDGASDPVIRELCKMALVAWRTVPIVQRCLRKEESKLMAHRSSPKCLGAVASNEKFIVQWPAPMASSWRVRTRGRVRWWTGSVRCHAWQGAVGTDPVDLGDHYWRSAAGATLLWRMICGRACKMHALSLWFYLLSYATMLVCAIFSHMYSTIFVKVLA